MHWGVMRFLLGKPGRMKEAFEAVICSGWTRRCWEGNADGCASPGTALGVLIKDLGM